MLGAPAIVPFAVVTALLSLAPPASALPRPGEPASHEAYAREVKAAQAAALQQTLAVYDEALVRNPTDVVAAVERCRLLDQTLPADDDEEDAGDEAIDARRECTETLASRFPKSPPALLYRLERVWGAKQLAFAEELAADSTIPWRDGERAQLQRQLALLYDGQGKTALAQTAARAALALDRSLDLSLLVGKQLLAQGRRADAIVALSTHPDGNGFALLEKAQLLADAGAPLRGLWLAEIAHREHHMYVAPAQLGAMLEQAGRRDDARKEYALQPDAPDRHQTLAHLFQLDLAGDDAARADHSYQALRDLGWRADPFGGYRLALARRFPSRSWRRRDALGLFGFALALLLSLLLPILWVAPMHYWSLWRRERQPLHLPPPRLATRWRLRQLWLGSAALVLAQTFGSFIFGYADATSFWYRATTEKVTQTPRELANVGVVILVGEVLLLALMVVRRRDLPLFGPGRWTIGKSLGYATLAYLGFLVLVGGWWLLTRDRPVAGLLSVEEMITSIRQVYGVAAVVLVIVILTPLAEELLFRSLMLDVFARYLPLFAANVLQASLFALAHGDPKRLVYLFLLGFIAGWLRARSGGLLASMTLHALNNAYATALALSVAAHPAAPAVAPKPLPAKLSAALTACLASAPPIKGLPPMKLPMAIELNNAAWRIAIDPHATADCLRQAEDAVDAALGAMPDAAVELDTEATVFYRQGRLDEAIDLERMIIERFGGGSIAYAQLARFLRARQERLGPVVLGPSRPAAAQLTIVDVPGGQALQLDVGAAFADGATLYYRAVGSQGPLSLLRVQIGPRHERSYRLVSDGGALQLDGKELHFYLALVDSRGCEGCAPGFWSWSMQFPDRTVDGYP